MSANVKFKPFTAPPAPQVFFECYESLFSGKPTGVPALIGDKIYLLPAQMPATRRISILRAGVLAGEMKGKRFVPAHHLFSAADATKLKKAVSLSLGDARLGKYLHGEEIDVADCGELRGYCAVSVEGIPLGFGKVSGGKMKNHYPKGLRNVK